MKTKYIQYYVEGDDEEKVVKILKDDLKVIRSGKIQRLNVVEQKITDLQLRTLKSGTAVVLVFDTDTENTLEIFQNNIETLRACKSVSDIITIPQVYNLEDEFVYCCDIKCAPELLNSSSIKDYKRELLRITNLAAKLQEHKFDIEKFWARKPKGIYQSIDNCSAKIKL